MTLFKTSFVRKITIFLAAAILSVSAMAADFNQTERLANQGNASAQYHLALMYDNGEGVRQDYHKAVEWYQKAAAKAHAKAQSNLGLMYDMGKGVRQDYHKAFELYQKAAHQGNVVSQINLGAMYYQGDGVRQNRNEAKEWFGKACDNGSQDGCEKYRRLNQK